MALYGKSAEMAARLLEAGHEVDPRSAWNRAVAQIFPPGSSSADKGCPCDAFLSLCSSGAVKSVPAGSYTRSVKNRRYIDTALAAVRHSPALIHDPKQLWKIATANADIRPNYQIEVLAALWIAGLIEAAPHNPFKPKLSRGSA